MSVGNDSWFVVCRDCRRYVAAIDKAIAENARLTSANAETVAALRTAVDHIEHMAAWITAHNSGYSFESLGEDAPLIRSILEAASSAADRRE